MNLSKNLDDLFFPKHWLVIALMFFDQEAGFNPPAMAATKIAALMHVVGV